MKINIDNLFNIDKIHNNLLKLRLDNGLYLASTGQYYQKIWVRDTFYCVLPELELNPELYKQTYHSLLDYYIKMERTYSKFTWMILEPNNKMGYRYPHPRLTKELNEINEPWGFKQLDCFGEFLYGIWLGESNDINIIRNQEDKNIINLIIAMLEKIEYWKDPDNGIWEEYEEVHISSIGSCMAGLTAIKLLGFNVNKYLLEEGHNTLNKYLPKESDTKFTDLALLTLIYPFNLIDIPRAKQIIANVEADLLRDRGVIRYIGDAYYNKNLEHPIGNEAEWCFGLAYLSLAYTIIGNSKKSLYYLNQLSKCVLNEDSIPELFYAKTNKPNENNPLGWSLAMCIVACNEYCKKFK